jgi:lysophospholipase L1-like esterase
VSALAEGTSPSSRRAQRLTNMALLLVSVTLALFTGELVTRAVLPAPLPWKYPQVRYRPDPRLVFALQPSQDAYTADKPAHINARGLRGQTVPYEKSSGRLRILFLGDSIAFGFGVLQDDTLSAQVSRLLSEKGLDVETINAAVPAYNTEQEVIFLETEGRRYHPDWVVLVTCWNDISEKVGMRVTREGSLVTEGAADDPERWQESRTLYELRNILKRSRLLYSVMEGLRVLKGSASIERQAILRDDILEGRQTPQLEAGWERIAVALERFRHLASREAYRLLIVAIPIPMALDRPYPKSEYPSRLEQMSRDLQIPFLDLQPTFASTYHGHESLFIPYDADHPNAAGHALAAREIARAITRTRGSS